MSDLDDDQGVRALDDEMLLSGTAVPAEPELSAFVTALRASSTSVPRPSPALAALLRDGLPAQTGSSVVVPLLRGDTRRTRVPLRVAAGLAVAARIALGAGVAAAAVTGAAAVEGMPSVLQTPAQAVVSGIADLFGQGRPDTHGPAAPAIGVSERSNGKVDRAPYESVAPSPDDHATAVPRPPAVIPSSGLPARTHGATRPSITADPRPGFAPPLGSPEPRGAPGSSQDAPGSRHAPGSSAAPTVPLDPVPATGPGRLGP